MMEIEFDRVHSEFAAQLSKQPRLILYIGPGRDRTVSWLAKKGHSVFVVESSNQARKDDSDLKPQANICRITDSLPKLRRVRDTGSRFDVIILNDVWPQLARSNRTAAFRRIVRLLNPAGLIYITHRYGQEKNPVHLRSSVTKDINVEELARDFGLIQVGGFRRDALAGLRADDRFRLLFRTPGDGTGALALLRGVILNDKKSSTYKLGLLKVLQHITQSASGLADFEGDEKVVIPLGLFALFWLRVYLPLLDKNLPQSPGNRSGVAGLGFMHEDIYKKLKHFSPHDIRVGMKFSKDDSKTLHSALRKICSTLVNMPMTHTTYIDGNEPVFQAKKLLNGHGPVHVELDKAYLSSFGHVGISADLWHACSRHGTWIEPAIVGQWKHLMKQYLDNQNCPKRANFETMEKALAWRDPKRTTKQIRDRFIELIESGQQVNCVWSNTKLMRNNFNVDHCFPYSAWPCGDMWNLLPASQNVNQKQKRDKLPSVPKLEKSESAILEWWQKAYIEKSGSTKQEFFNQARASLRVSVDSHSGPSLDDIFESLVVQQHKLRVYQQIPQW